ncbi:MAG: non-homologous end-joining DNA ligase [Zhengella sp.]
MDKTAERLADYVAKRDFTRTAEPSGTGRGAASQRPRFIVQKHDASRLHYDFRLEWDGVLLSWAVTRGPSADPSEKRLAVRTEDHPLDYGDFEGTIPQGEYGGGTVMLWDQGTWAPQEDFASGLEKGKLKFTLYGSRMKGGWALVRMRGKDKRENWLLIKEHDAFEEDDTDALTSRFETSVTSGRSMAAIAEGRKPEKPTSKQSSKREKSRGFDLARPQFHAPELARLVDAVPHGDGWLHEVKFDGYRCLAALGKGGVRLYSRSGLDWTDRYKGLPEAFCRLECRNALIDGEVVSASAGKGSSFSALQRDLEEGRPVLFMAFDLLHLNGDDLSKQPLDSRKDRLEQLLAGLPEDSPVRFSEHVRGHGQTVFDNVRKAGGEGIVAKKADSRYTGKRSGAWLKIKAGRRQEFVVAGWSPSDKKGRPFSSLILGTHEDGDLVYRGRVGSGFGADAFDRLAPMLDKLGRKTAPVTDVPSAVARDARWVTPKLVVEVEMAELTDQGIIRHGVYLGLRDDKDARTVKLEKPK